MVEGGSRRTLLLVLMLVAQLYGGRDGFAERDCIHDGMYDSGLRRMLFLVTVIQSYLGGGLRRRNGREIGGGRERSDSRGLLEEN